MIDYITAKFPCTHDRASLPQFKERYVRIRLKHLNTTIEVKSIDNGRFLVLSGNPAKYLQGHNIFGSDDLQGLCHDLLAAVAAQLNIRISHTDQQAIIAGQYSLSRVDLAVNFRLPSNEMVSKAIREIEWCWRELGHNVSNYGDETVYHNQHSKVTATKFYNKGREIYAHPLPEYSLGNYACTRLCEYADRLLRAEFTLRSPALKKMGLNLGSKWTIKKARALIEERSASQLIQRKITRLMLPSNYMQLPLELRQTYRLWLQGNDLHSLFGERTLHRRRKSLLIFGIDIKRPPTPARISSVSLGTLLAPKNIVRLPKFARQLGLVHLPSRTTK